jgi:hypothetical protein
LEVQDRAVHETRGLSRAPTAAWAQRWVALAFATVITVAALIVDAQPLRSPWWAYADADASYTASALNLMLGREVTFVDHPGLPVTEAVAVAFGAEALVETGSLSESARLAYADATLLDLDSARGTFRGFAIGFYLLGAALSFLLAARLFGHWTWGLACGLLWIAAPGLVAMSIQLRPDVLLAALTVVFGFAVARAVEERSPGWYAGAAFVGGFSAMVKLHALALLPALLLAMVWRPPDQAALRGLPGRARGWMRAHAVAAGSVLGLWLALVILVNAARWPFSITAGQVGALAAVLGFVAAAFAAAEAVMRIDALRPLGRAVGHGTATLVAAFAAGLLLPATISLPEGLRALVYMWRNVSGQGVQEGVDSFSTPVANLHTIVGVPVVLVFLIAAFAAVMGLIRRDPRPVVWATAALSMGAMAFARAPNVHYFAPSFVLATLCVLWLVQRAPHARTSLLVWPLVLYVIWPAWDTRESPAAEQRRLEALVAPAKAFVDERLGPGEIALVPSYWPFADSRFFELVEIYVEHTPQYPYRYLPATAAVRPFAGIRQLRPRFFVGSQVVGLPPGARVQLGDLGEYTLAPAQGGGGIVAEIVQGPGVTEPW